MSPGQLLEQLESLGTIDPKILGKIRKELDNPEKSVKPKSVLSYLVKKNQITESQAAQILKGALKPPPTVPPQSADEFDLAETSQEPEYDTSDLTGLLLTPDAPPEPVKPVVPKAPPSEPDVEPIIESGATIMDDEQYDELSEVSSEIEPIEEPTYSEPVQSLAGFGDASTDDEFGDHHAAPTSRSSASFRGKKDKSDQWSTKWLYIGFGILGVLLIMGGVLYIATMGVKAEDQFKAAMDSFEKSAYQDAAKKFDEYIVANPSHKYVPTAKARMTQCLIASAFTSRNWVETIKIADNLLPELADAEDSKIDLIRDDLGLMLPESLMHITDASKKSTDLAVLENALATDLELKKVIDNNVYIPTSIRKKPTTAANLARIDNNIRVIQGEINKERDYNAAIAEIAQLRDASETDKAFATYKKLTRNYGDLAAREQLQNAMLEISLKEIELVKTLPQNLNVANEDRLSPIQTTVVMATRSGALTEALEDEVVNFLAEGSVYGLNAGTGAILWRRFVGFQTFVQPEMLDQDSILVADQQQHDLLRLEKSTGRVIWRTEIGEPFLKPAMNEHLIVVTTDSGKVIPIDRESGRSAQAVQLPQSTNVSALVAEREPYIYQPGSYSNIYVLSNQDMSCREVFYLGHYDGSIAIPPQAWLDYILVAVNGGDYCDLMVLKPAENGLKLELVQVINRVTNGPVTSPMQRFGRWMLLTGDTGEIRVLELLPNEASNPVRLFASEKYDNSSGQTSFTLSEGSNLWVAGSGISRYRIKRNQGQFDRDEIMDHSDTFLTPLQKLDDTLFHVSRRHGSGMLSASLVDATSLHPIWRTDFGGQLVGSPLVTDNAVVTVSNQGDVFRITQQEQDNRYAEATSQASTVVEDLRFENLVQLPGESFACIGPITQEDFLYASTGTGQSKLMRLQSPANRPACHPISIGESIIVPSTEGQVARIDPTKGTMIGTPFQPPISPGTKTEWFEPTLISENLFAIASGNGDTDANQSMMYLLDTKNPRSIVEISSLTPDAPFKSRLVNDGEFVYAVAETGEFDVLVSVTASPKLEVSNKADLPGRVVEGPWLLDTGILLKMDNDQLLLLAKDLSTTWTLSLPNDQFAGAPEKAEAGLLLSFRSGKMIVVERGTGAIIQSYDLRQPIVHAPTRVGDKMFLSGMDGTLHIVDLSQMSGKAD
jgi:outer membrane protein assembly factor BamB